jgi:hypothetical protein
MLIVEHIQLRNSAPCKIDERVQMMHMLETHSITADMYFGHLEMKVASLYNLPSTSSPPESPGSIESGPRTNSLTGLIHCRRRSQL